MELAELSCRDVQYVLAVAEHLHFGHAAEACAVSQPALSKQIALLEKQLGMRLFERNKRTVQLTPPGQRFVAQAQLFWQSGISLLDTARQAEKFEQLPWRVGIIASVCPFVLPRILPDIIQKLPALTVQEGMTHELIAALMTGELDMVWAAATVTHDTLQATLFYWERFYLATTSPELYPSPIPPQYRVDADKLILLKDGHCLTDQTLGLCGSPQRITAIRAQQLDTVVAMAASHLGDAVVPAMATRPAQGLTYLPFSHDGRQLVLFTRRTSEDSQQLARFFVQHWAAELAKQGLVTQQ
jgi:LysR family transcriptional regulator, hydrogen peroxide-inducible genes activator